MPKPCLNRTMLRAQLTVQQQTGHSEDLCEWEPRWVRPARLSDTFHDFATISVGAGEHELAVCPACLKFDEVRVRSMRRQALGAITGAAHA